MTNPSGKREWTAEEVRRDPCGSVGNHVIAEIVERKAMKSGFVEEHLTNMNIYDFWKAVLGQNEIEIRKYFQNDAYINWHCTNERFNVDEFIIANCEYPGDWEGSVERVETLNDLIVTVVNVYPKGRNASFHVTCFIKTKEDKIVSMDEYWADDGNAPQWRLDKHIGKAIR